MKNFKIKPLKFEKDFSDNSLSAIVKVNNLTFVEFKIYKKVLTDRSYYCLEVYNPLRIENFYLRPYDDEYNCSTKHNIGTIEAAKEMANNIYQNAMESFVKNFSKQIFENE